MKMDAAIWQAELANMENRGLLAHPQATEICNGIGAWWMPKGLRWLITALHPSMHGAAAIHDMQYWSGGTAGARLDAELAFLRISCRAALCMYGWWDIRRYLAFSRALRFFALLRLFGSSAWCYRGRKEAL